MIVSGHEYNRISAKLPPQCVARPQTRCFTNFIKPSARSRRSHGAKGRHRRHRLLRFGRRSGHCDPLPSLLAVLNSIVHEGRSTVHSVYPKPGIQIGLVRKGVVIAQGDDHSHWVVTSRSFPGSELAHLLHTSQSKTKTFGCARIHPISVTAALSERTTADACRSSP